MIFDLIVYTFAVIGAVLVTVIVALGIFSKLEKDAEPDWDYEFDDYIINLTDQIPVSPPHPPHVKWADVKKERFPGLEGADILNTDTLTAINPVTDLAEYRAKKNFDVV